MPDTVERLRALHRRLTTLLGERRALEFRWILAATKANHWPDLHRASERLASTQPAADRPDTTTARMGFDSDDALPRTPE
jgi:hypothetical protein